MTLSPIQPDVIPFASPHLAMAMASDGALCVETPEAILTYGAREADEMVAWLDAARSLPDAIERSRWACGDRRRFDALIGPALEVGAVWNAAPFVEATTCAEQLAAYYRLCDAWALDIFVGPFWRKVLGGQASTALMLCWCEQFYHRTVGADEHNAQALDHCQIPSVAEALRSHFSQELGHGEIFLLGLEAAGVSRRVVASRPPLPSTLALINFFNDLASTDTLSYLACYGVLHSPREGQSLATVQRQFQWLAKTYPDAAPAILRVGEHAEIDIQSGHDQIAFEAYLAGREPLSHEEAARVLSAVHSTVVIFNQFFGGILQACEADQTPG